MGLLPRGVLTKSEQAFSDYYFEERNPALAAINAGYPENRSHSTSSQILRRPHIKAYLRELWEVADSPVVMGVRERKEILSEIGRGMVGDCLDEDGQVDLKAIRGMPAVKEVTIEETSIGTDSPVLSRTIKVKLLNPVEAIHELNFMEQKLNRPETPMNQGNRVVNIYVTDKDVKEKLGKIGERTQKVIELTGETIEEPGEQGE